MRIVLRAPHSSALAAVLMAALAAAQPPPDLNTADWADTYRRLSRESSAEPGQWRTSRAPYLREILEAFSDPALEEVCWMKGAQVAYTDALLCDIGRSIHLDPGPAMMVLPTLELARESISKDRFRTMVRDTPALRGRVKRERSKDAESTLLHKTFPGGHLTFAGANSPSSLSSRPIRRLYLDEVDRYPHSAGSEGDPITLARKRTTTFWNRKIIAGSTPTIKGQSRIEALFEESDQRRYWIPCHACDAMQTLKWGQIRWESGDARTAHYHCESCGVAWSDHQRVTALDRGEWRAARPERKRRGYHLSQLYSPFNVKIEDLVAEFLEAKGNPELLKAFVNTVLAETWEIQGNRKEPSALEARAENYDPDPLPPGVLVLTAGVDCQDDRLEGEIVGWGVGQESWSIDYYVLHGDPSGARIWEELDVLLQQRFRLPGTGMGTIGIAAACIDSGGHFTDQVYAFCGPRFGRRVYAIRGRGGEGIPLWPRERTKGLSEKCPIYTLGVDAGKETLWARLEIDQPGPGFCHFRSDYPPSYFERLTNEERRLQFSRGVGKPVWFKLGRNEPLDCRNYAQAALASLAIDLDRLGAARTGQAPPAPSHRASAPINFGRAGGSQGTSGRTAGRIKFGPRR